MPKVEQERIQARMTEWAQMTPQERGRARLRFQVAKRLQSSDRQRQVAAVPGPDPRATPGGLRCAAQRSASVAPCQRGTPRQASAPASHRPRERPRRHLSVPPPSGCQACPRSGPLPRRSSRLPGATTTLDHEAGRPQQAARPTPHTAAARDTINTTTLLPRKAASSRTNTWPASPAPRLQN